MSFLKRSLVAALASLSWACISAEPGAENVRLTANPEIVRGCRFLGNVQDNNIYGTESAENALRNDAAHMGGNVVLMVSPASVGGLHAHASGEAYACGASPSSPPPDFKLKPGEEFVSEESVPVSQRLKPLANYQILTIQAKNADGTTRVYQVYAQSTKPPQN
jgi:hypothetical protein